MRVSDKIMQIIEEKLEDPEAVENIKRRILAPSLSILQDEIKKSGTNETLTALANGLLWPVILMISATLFISFLLLNIQLYICITR